MRKISTALFPILKKSFGIYIPIPSDALMDVQKLARRKENRQCQIRALNEWITRFRRDLSKKETPSPASY